MDEINFETYQSPFSWRYGSKIMREIFSEVNRRKTWREVWVAIAKSQNQLGLINKSELANIIANKNKIDIKKAHIIEKEIKHDLMAEVKTFAAQAKIGGGKIHLGATSQDIEDNADIIIYKKALTVVEGDLKSLLKAWVGKISQNANVICMAYTHLQPAEPTTLGYRFAVYAQDLLIDLENLKNLKNQIKGKGIKGAVGNSASYVSLLGKKAETLEKQVLADLKIDAFKVTGQVYPRKLDYLILNILSAIAQSLHKFAFDLRIMQSAQFGEWMEPRGEKQVGSSAMPFKRNPQNAEKICSLARLISQMPKVAWDNAANSLLERTLDDSAARRIIIPESFLAIDEILKVTIDIVEKLTINKNNIEKNLNIYGPFSALETILLKSVKKGADRQKIHEELRKISMITYAQMEKGGKNTLFENVQKDKEIGKYLGKEEIEQLSDYKTHIGLAPKKATDFARQIKQYL